MFSDTLGENFRNILYVYYIQISCFIRCFICIVNKKPKILLFYTYKIPLFILKQKNEKNKNPAICPLWKGQNQIATYEYAIRYSARYERY
ncbi:hypothetical protein Hanom_Chr07g00660091 [Helianthus anomalus]